MLQNKVHFLFQFQSLFIAKQSTGGSPEVAEDWVSTNFKLCKRGNHSSYLHSDDMLPFVSPQSSKKYQDLFVS